MFFPTVGKTPREKVDCDMMLENAMDFRNGVIRLCYDNDYVSLCYVTYNSRSPINYLTCLNNHCLFVSNDCSI